MTAPNRNTLWAAAFVDELARGGVSAACITPGSRSTPLTVAFAEHEDVHVYSLLDERSAAFFALGRAKRTGEPTPLVCTSGTAAANYHPAVIEASQSRIPLVCCTADRPPEIRDSGANQTIDQEKLYGDAVRWYRDVAEPEATPRKLRSLRTTAARALAKATGTPPGPVHLNFPFRKPLEPTPVEGDVPDDLSSLAAEGRDGGGSRGTRIVDGRTTGSDAAPFVRREAGVPELDPEALARVGDALTAERGLLVAGPADATGVDPQAVASLAHATGFPILADPLSGLRYGGHTRVTTVCGAYDGYLGPELVDAWPDPEVVLRLGASPTSKPLREYLAAVDVRQLVVDPAAGWREAEFAATDHVVADPSRLCARLAHGEPGQGPAAGPSSDDWRARWERAERVHGDVVEAALGELGGERASPVAEADREGEAVTGTGAADEDDDGDDIEGDVPADPVATTADAFFEGAVLADVVDLAPEPTTLFVSNSMPVRDLDRFGAPTDAGITALGNRGASGIDGIVSTALGAGSATTDELTLVTGDLAYYHDMNGLLALGRCDVDATVVLVNNDGGGIFHLLPIESFDPPFTQQFVTPHGLDFAPTGELYDLSFARVGDRASFRSTYAEAVATDGTHVIEVTTDAESSHRRREELRERVVARLLDGTGGSEGAGGTDGDRA
jgi:2-succinyl-5-enolpyruvyl-6-hydroxy-3-cyclohexene-1-carboxylate synthase